MNYNNAVFEKAFATAEQLEESDLPEICFCGRSNVGKSSLINAVLGRKSIARVSSKPGKTVTVNFYRVDGMRLVDLPGYGYAKRSKKEVAKLDQMIRGYILQREQMVNVFVLVDSRHEPQAIDLEFIDWLGQSGVPFAIVFTKTDKLSGGKASQNIANYKKKLQETWEELPPMFLTSSESRQGRDELLDYIDSINQQLKG